MISTGCTALAETWEVIQGEASANHFMLGYITTWLTERVAGLRQAPASIGWASVIIEPRGITLLDSAAVDFDSPAGTYRVHWAKAGDDGRVTLAVTVPEGGAAKLRPPRGYALVDGVHELSAGDHHLSLQRKR